MIHLEEKYRNEIVKLARQILSPLCEIWAFGSRVKRTHQPASDLDLVIHFPKVLTQNQCDKQLSDFKLALQDSTLPIFVQVFDWRLILDFFKSQINAAYDVLEF